jgi:hypothetical protein
MQKLLEMGGFPKTSVFGKATLDLLEKTVRPLFRKPFPKPTEFWERLMALRLFQYPVKASWFFH